MSMDSDGEQAIHAALRSIENRLGKMDAKLDAGQRRHDGFAADIKGLQDAVKPLPDLCKTVEGIQPIVEDYKRSRNVFTGVVLAVSTALGGLVFWGTEIKAFARLVLFGKGG